MALRTAAWIVLALSAVGAGAGRSWDVEIFNNTLVDLLVLVDAGRGVEIIPGESGKAVLGRDAWIEFGQMEHQYRMPRGPHGPLRLQAEPDGNLYLVPPGVGLPLEKLPPQPKGFPLVPAGIVDLT